MTRSVPILFLLLFTAQIFPGRSFEGSLMRYGKGAVKGVIASCCMASVARVPLFFIAHIGYNGSVKTPLLFDMIGWGVGMLWILGTSRALPNGRIGCQSFFPEGFHENHKKRGLKKESIGFITAGVITLGTIYYCSKFVGSKR